MEYFKIAQDVLSLEASALLAAKERLSKESIDSFVRIVDYLKSVGGNLIFCGVGKSGVIAQKLASTFSSLGLPSFFLHPVEALHGDLGRVTKSDAIVFISKSGTTSEILHLIPYLDIDQKLRLSLIGNMESPIAKLCGVNFDCSVEKEACINGQAPTTSSTLALAMGDALAVVFESYIGLSREGFAQNHPGGLLGKSLRLKVRDLMWQFAECPVISKDATMREVIVEMTKKPVGGCAVVEGEKLLGIIVEGDIRRTFLENSNGIDLSVTKVMNPTPVNVHPDELAFNALELMEKRRKQIDILPVVQEGKFLGFLRLHDLLKEGFIAGK